MSAFDKIIGYKDIKIELARICDVLKNAQKYKSLGVTSAGGLLLDGVPGIGKTLMANCFISESGRKAFVCRKNKSEGDFVNEIKNVFDEAAQNAPSIVLLDDMDKFANEDVHRKNAVEYVAVQSCMDELNGKDVFVIATTNGTNNLPASLLRAGRFDTVITVNTPDKQDAVEIVKFYLSTKKSIAEVNAEDIARLLSGKSCADLEAIINVAGRYAGYQDKEYIDMEDITKACLRTIYNAPESTEPTSPNLLQQIAYHEAGHTVVAEILQNDSVDFVTIRKNTGTMCGFTSIGIPDDYWFSKTSMENRVVSILAGKAATEIVFGQTDTLANDDLHRAFNIVKRFADDYCAYGFDYWTERNSSSSLIAKKEERTAIDMEQYYTKAKRILIENRAFLDEIAKRLQEKDTLVYSEIKAIRTKTVNI